MRSAVAVIEDIHHGVQEHHVKVFGNLHIGNFKMQVDRGFVLELSAGVCGHTYRGIAALVGITDSLENVLGISASRKSNDDVAGVEEVLELLNEDFGIIYVVGEAEDGGGVIREAKPTPSLIFFLSKAQTLIIVVDDMGGTCSASAVAHDEDLLIVGSRLKKQIHDAVDGFYVGFFDLRHQALGIVYNFCGKIHDLFSFFLTEYLVYDMIIS